MRRRLAFLPGSGDSPRAITRKVSRCIGLSLCLLTLFAPTALAQAPVPSHGLNPNFGTWSVGEVAIALEATGGSGPGTYTWQIVGGALPAGVSLRSDMAAWPSWPNPNTSGMLLGVATTPGTYNFVLRVTSGGISVDQNATLRVVSLAIGNVWEFPRAYVGKPYAPQQLIALNATGPVTWSLNSGTLPPGIDLSSAGVVSGTPTQSGYYNINVRLTSGGISVSRWVNLDIHVVEIVNSAELPPASNGVPYNVTLTGSGGTAPYTFATSGFLPSGLVLDPSGTISGTSTAGRGVQNFQVTMTDAHGVSTWKNMAINTLFAPQQAPRFSVYSNFGDDCTLGWVCERGMSANSGGTAPFTFTISGQPPGMGLAFRDYIYPNHLLIGGVPTQTGTYNVQVTVTDALNVSTTQVFPIRVSPLLQRFDSFRRTDLVDGLLNVPYSSKVSIIGGVLPYIASIVNGQLPPGLSFNPANFTVSGTPTSAGFFSVDFEFVDAANQRLRVTDSLTIDGSETTASNGGTISIFTFHQLGTAITGNGFSRTLTACCAPSYLWTAIDPLPPGLSLSSNGVLSGTPTTNGSYSFLIRVADGLFPNANWAQQRFFLTVAPVSPSITVTTGVLPFGNVGTAYNVLLAATGGTGTLTWSLAPENYLPPGFVLEPDGRLHADSPIATGQYGFSVNVTDGTLSGARFFTLFIYGIGQNAPLDVAFGPNLGTFNLGQLTSQLTASGGVPPYHYSFTPGANQIPGTRIQDGQPLPTNFTSTGGFIGVLSESGFFTSSLRVIDSQGTILDRPFNMTVVPFQILSQSPLPRALVGSPYSFSFTPYGGGGVYAWSASNLPPGISINSSGQVQGTPTAFGNFFPTITLTDLTTNLSRGFGYTLVVDPFSITNNGELPDGVNGAFYSQTFTAPGCQNCVWTATNLHPGLTFVNGVMSGTLNGVTSGRGITITATGSNGTVQKVFSLKVLNSALQPLSIANGASLQTVLGGATAQALFALGGTPPYTWTLDSGTLPTGVTLDGPGEALGANLLPGFSYLAGKAMVPGFYNFTMRVTDALARTTTLAFTWNVTRLAQSFTFLPLVANTLRYGVPYTQPLLGLGGTSNYTWTNGLPMPPGLVLDPTGVVSGVPTNTGTFTVPIGLADDAGNVNASNVNFTIVSPTGTTLVFGRAANLGTITRGANFSSDLLLSGGTPPYNVTALTALPPGLTLLSGASLPSGSGSSWFVAGNPLATGTFTFTLEVTDSVANVGARTFTMVVSPIQIVTAGGLANTAVGSTYLQPLVAGGGTGALTWSLATGSTLPPGVTLSAGGVLAGIPTQTGTFTFNIIATDATGNAFNRTFTLIVAGMAITDPEILPAVTTTVPYSYTFSATGGNGPLVWSATGLPFGLTLSPTGTLSGTVFSPSQGFTAFNVSVTDGVTTFTRRFATYFASSRFPLLSLPPSSAPFGDLVVGTAGFLVLPGGGGSVGGGTPPYRWSVAPGSSLPPGMALDQGSHLTPSFNPGQAILVGSATTAGTYVFDLVVTDARGQQMVRTFTINVSNIALFGVIRVPVAGTAYAQQFTTLGGTPPYNYTMTPLSPHIPMLPPGLSLSASGLLSGTTTSTGTYQFRLRVTDNAGNTFTRAFQFLVSTASGLRVTTDGFDDLMMGGSVEEGLSLVGNPTPSSVAWSHVGGTLPPGLNVVTDSLMGWPTAAGTYIFTLRGTDPGNAANFADREFRVRVVPMQIVSPPMRFGWGELPGGHVGQPYSTTIKIAGGVPPYTFAANPLLPLPAGLTLSAAGVLSGTPLQTGGYEIEFDVSDSAGNTASFDDLSLAITPAGVPRPLVRDDGFLGFASRGVEFGGGIQGVLDFLVRGGVKPFSWSLTSGSTLPPGLSILPGGNGVSDMLVGIPTQAGEFSFSLDVVDAVGETLTVGGELPVFPTSIRPHTIPNGIVGSGYSATLIASGGVAPYAFELFSFSDLPPGLTLSQSGVLSGTPTTAGNFFVAVHVTDDVGSEMAFGYRVTINNAAGQANAITILPDPKQVTYVQGAPILPESVNIGGASGIPFTAAISGIPGATLSLTSGTTPQVVGLNLGLGSLTPGTYFGFVGVAAPASANLYDIVPLTVTVVPPPPCAFVVNPTGASVPSSGGSGSFKVETQPTCAWTATKTASWITLIGASGTGTRTVSYVALPNPTSTARTGDITVNGTVYTITQFGAAATCQLSINPSVINATAAGGTADIAVTASRADCIWTASGLNATEKPNDGSPGNGTVTVVIPANGSATPVTLTATIAGQTLTVNQTGVGCTVSVLPAVVPVSAAGGQHAVQVTAPVGCSYSTVTGQNWISVASGGSGGGTGNPATILLDVAANSTTVARSGSVTIGGQTVQIDQAALACSVTVDTSGLGSPFGPAGGVGLIGVTANGANCNWTASSADGFATVSPQTATGNGSVAVTVSSNAASTTGRSTNLTIAGQTVALQQSGTTCSPDLQSLSGNVPASGGSGTVGVIAPSVCAWTAISNTLSWLTVSSPGGSGSTGVQFVALANTSATPREGTLTVANKTYTVTQAGAPCSYALTTSNLTVASSGLSSSVAFSTTATGCSPTAVSYASWIKNVGTTFNGSTGSVDFTVDPTPYTSTRVGTIQLGEQTFTITQSGGACGYSLNAYGALFNSLGGTGSVLGSPTALGCVPQTGTAEPTIITLQPLGGPVSNIFTQDYSVAPYPNVLTPTIRKAYIIFGGQIFTVKQTSW
jgi:hypothetical protein